MLPAFVRCALGDAVKVRNSDDRDSAARMLMAPLDDGGVVRRRR
jgi:hypothetical protein